MMMLAANLEPALDRKQISFIETKESMEHPEIRVRQYQMKVWDEKILDFYIWQDSEHKVQEYDGHVFSFPLGNGPFTRVLSCQAQLCYNIAVKQGWVSQDYDRPQEFGTPVREVFTTPIANRTFDSRDSPRSCRNTKRTEKQMFGDDISRKSDRTTAPRTVTSTDGQETATRLERVCSQDRDDDDTNEAWTVMACKMWQTPETMQQTRLIGAARTKNKP